MAICFAHRCMLRLVSFSRLHHHHRLSAMGRDRPAAPEQPRRRPRREEDPIVHVSKKMSRCLRHHPPPGAMDEQGWVALPTLLQHLGLTEAQVRQVVESNDKKRFVLDDATTPARIRAAQGHSVQLEAPVLAPVVSADEVEFAVHATDQKGWQAIQASGELRRMSRTHIHFAMQPHHMRTRAWAAGGVLLRPDVAAAMGAGHRFVVSSNGVLLCEGPLPVEFVTVVQGNELPATWQEAGRQHGAPRH